MSDREPLFSDWDRSDRPMWGLSEYRQTRRIYDLEDELASARAMHRQTARNLRSELSKVRGSLEQRLDRLSKAFDAFVEMSDVRLQLAVFDGAAAVRLRAKQVIVGVGGTQDVPDVDGYWLVPALRALYAAGAGEDPTAQLTAAAGVSARRAALFHALTSAQFGRGESVSADQLRRAFGEVEDQITLAQRALWTLAADGHYGPTGHRVVQEILGAFIATLGEGTRDQQIAKWCRAVRLEPSARKLPEEYQSAKLPKIVEASDRLSV